MKKTLLIVLGILLVAGAVGGYIVYTKMGAAEKDVQNLVNPDEEKIEKSEFQALADKALADDAEAIRLFTKAREASKSIDAKLWFDILKMQSGSESAAVRMNVVDELGKLEGEHAATGKEILKKMASDDPDEDVQMMAGMILEEEEGVETDEEDSE